MLGKLIKYEFKATARIFLPMFAAILAVSAITRLLFFLQFDVPATIAGFLAAMLMFGAGIGIFVLTIQRFYHNLIGGEGYLTHTLPVGTDSLIWSKLIVSAVWYLAGALVIFASILLLSATGQDMLRIFRDFRDLFARAAAEVSVWHIIALTLESILFVIVSLFASILLIYACLSSSFLVNRRRGLFSFGAFLALVTATEIVVLLCVRIGDAIGISGVFDGLSAPPSTLLSVLLLILAAAAPAAVYYLLTRYFLKRRLNLE